MGRHTTPDQTVVQRRVRGSRRRWAPRVAVASTVLAVTGGLTVMVQGTADAANVVANSTFDTLDGWGINSGASLRRVSGRDGSGVRMTQPGPGRRTIALNDLVNSVQQTVKGTSYQAEAWVRSTRSGQGVSLRIMEYRNTTYLSQKVVPVTLSDTAWHRLKLTYTATTSGASLDLNIVAQQLPAGVGVDVDDVRLFAPDAPKPPTSTATVTSSSTAPPGHQEPTPSTKPPATTSTTGSANTSTSTTSVPPVTGSTTQPAVTTSTPAVPTTTTVPTTTVPKTTTPTTSTPATTAPVTTSAPATSTPPVTSTVPAPVTPTITKPTGTSTTAPAGWKLVWADEFTGSGVDSARWKVEHNSTYGDGNKELACLMNRPQNLSVSGGVLSLRATHEATPFKCGSADSRFPNGRSYTSAHMSTKGVQDWKYGRFEVRAKLPTQADTSQGLWPAFWLRPTSGGTGELDVLEAIGSDAQGSETKRVHHTIWYDYSGTYKSEPKAATLPSGQPSDGFHTYAAEWEKGQIRWYVDGVLTYSRTSATTPWLDSAFNKPFYLRLNLAVGGSWPGAPSGDTDFPASYDVDYVRVYQR